MHISAPIDTMNFVSLVVILLVNVIVCDIKVSLDDDGPLILTDLLERGEIHKARVASNVTSYFPEYIKSFSGYFTVNKKHNSNLFFWCFLSNNDYRKDPVILWLQGGPGASSLIGLFFENGPFSFTKNHELKLRKYSWTANHTVIYIDNPVGTGFSFTDTEEGYARNETQIGKQLYEALMQFFTLFPELKYNDFYIAGESYAGKYIPAVAHEIHKNNPTASMKVNLKGIAIGNGYMDPMYQVGHGEHMYQLGLIDLRGKEFMEQIEAKSIQYIKEGEYIQSYKTMGVLYEYFKNVSGYHSFTNYLETESDLNEDLLTVFLNSTSTRRAIHVGNTTFDSNLVPLYLAEDVQKPITPILIDILNNYKVLLYTGQLDLDVAYPLTLNYLRNLKFDYAERYRTANRRAWYVGTELAGYSKTAGSLVEILVRNAGHMVPKDKPKWAMDMIVKFTRNETFV